MAELKVDILTLFPEMFDAVLKNSIIGRAVNNGILEITSCFAVNYTFDEKGLVTVLLMNLNYR